MSHLDPETQKLLSHWRDMPVSNRNITLKAAAEAAEAKDGSLFRLVKEDSFRWKVPFSLVSPSPVVDKLFTHLLGIMQLVRDSNKKTELATFTHACLWQWSSDLATGNYFPTESDKRPSGEDSGTLNFGLYVAFPFIYI